jgi:putative chitinase
MRVFNRQIFFDMVREAPFSGDLDQSQVDGMEAILDIWEAFAPEADRRWLGYCFSTTKHETASTIQPIQEYGKGQGQSYGQPDPETGEIYYGRGYVQLTWRDNYARADAELHLGSKQDLPTTSCEWLAENALKPNIAAAIMFYGMYEGWFRSNNKLADYFHGSHDDPYNARDIINGDKHIIPDWSDGMSIGNIIAGYYMDFTAALNAAVLPDV